MSSPTEVEYRSRGLVDVVVDNATPKSIATEGINRVASLSTRRPVHEDWITGWATLDPTYEYPLLSDRKIEGRVKFRCVETTWLRDLTLTQPASVPTMILQVSAGVPRSIDLNANCFQTFRHSDDKRRLKRLTLFPTHWIGREWCRLQRYPNPLRKAFPGDIAHRVTSSRGGRMTWAIGW